MTTPTRRQLLQSATAGAFGLSPMLARLGATTREENRQPNLYLASFRFDVTPPMGHSLCGGWIKPVVGVDDPLEAVGIVLLGVGKPIVLCAVDWTGLLNSANLQWRQALANAADTTPDRVAVHCVHQHNAPFACLDAERIVRRHKDLPHIVEVDFFRKCLDRADNAVASALKRAKRVTHIAHGQGKVDKVASNRRVSRDKEGKILQMRGSSCKDAKLRALLEGLIDPWLKTIAFYDNDKKLAACHYYATHPMSYYGDGRVSSDFAGLARKQRQKDEPNCLHLYFTGCAGNIAAGKYNDGSKQVRPILTKRVYDGIVASESNLKPEPVGSLAWRTAEVLPPPREGFRQDQLTKQIADPNNRVVNRNRPSYRLAWLQRLQREQPLLLSSLHINDIALLHMPAESFVEYQLRAQQLAPKRFVATAAYGDGGPWYIPTSKEYPNGGYEVSVAFCDPEIDALLTKAMRTLLE